MVKRVVYEPPRAVRLSQAERAAGVCSTGSGDQQYCMDGNDAFGGITNFGCGNGNNAVDDFQYGCANGNVATAPQPCVSGSSPTVG